MQKATEKIVVWKQTSLQYRLLKLIQTWKNKEVNVLLLGPQVRFMKGQFEQKNYNQKGFLLDVINMADYGMMNGEKVFRSSNFINGIIKLEQKMG